MSWPVVSLGDICTFRYGKSLHAGQRDGGEVSVYGSNGRVGQHSAAVTSGPTIIIGRKGSFGEVHFSPVSCWPIDTTYFVDGDSAKVDLRWLFHVLPSLRLTELNRAAAVPGLNREDAYRQKLLLPPLAEQRRVAAILDQADELVSLRGVQLGHLGELRSTIFIDTFGHPRTWPDRWRMSTIGELASSVDYGTSEKSRSVGDLPVLRMGNLTYSGDLELSDLKYTDSPTARTERYRLHRGDVLFNRTNSPALVGKTVVFDLDEPMTYAGYLLRIRLATGRALPEFLSGYLNTAYGKAVLRGMAKAAVSQSNINATQLKAMPIAQPPLEVQKTYLERLHVVRRYRDGLITEAATQRSLMASLKVRAFSGQLLMT